MINGMNETPGAPDINERFRALRKICLSFLSAVSILALITYLAREDSVDKAENNLTLLVIFAAIGVTNIAISFVLKNKFLAQAASEQRPEKVQTAYLIAFVLSESAAICGFLGVFFAGSPYGYLLFVVAVVGVLLHMPRREHLLAASYRTM